MLGDLRDEFEQTLLGQTDIVPQHAIGMREGDASPFVRS